MDTDARRKLRNKRKAERKRPVVFSKNGPVAPARKERRDMGRRLHELAMRRRALFRQAKFNWITQEQAERDALSFDRELVGLGNELQRATRAAQERAQRRAA